MQHPLFSEIEKFEHWAQFDSGIAKEHLQSLWEGYHNWRLVHDLFENLLNTTSPEKWTDPEKFKLLYIIALDNECERLAETLSENYSAFIALTQQAINSEYHDAKWQLAIRLHKLTDKQQAAAFLLHFVQDEEEYVNRRALMELAQLNSPLVEHYCEKFWHKNKYGDMEEYQRMAVLHALKIINSPKLALYIELAKHDGREYLVKSAMSLAGNNSICRPFDSV